MRHSERRFIIACVVCGIALFVFFSWRTPAMPQELNPLGTGTDLNIPSDRVAQQIAKNIAEIGYDIRVQRIGFVKEKEQSVKELSSEIQIILPYRGTFIFFDFDELRKSNFISDETDAYVRDNTIRRISVGDTIYEFQFGDIRTKIAISKIDLMPIGSFFAYSRLPGGRSMGIRSNTICCDREVPVENCQTTVLSYNILGNPAEQIKSCTAAMCSAERFFKRQSRSLNGLTDHKSPMDTDFDIKDCELESINEVSWGFGYVDYNPQNLPVKLKSSANFCKASIEYTWGLRFGSIKLGDKLGEFSLTDIGATKGNVLNFISCRSVFMMK